MRQQESATVSDQINMVGEGTVFDGTLRAKSDVRISGQVIGKLEIDGRAIIAEDGAVDGEIEATHADIAGTVQGEIHVQERLVLKSTARIDGNIHAGRIVVEEGALFSGTCSMGVSEPLRPHLEEKLEEEMADVASGAANGAANGEPEVLEEPDEAPVQ